MFGSHSDATADSRAHAGGDHGFFTDLALLGLRLTTGGLLAGHGAQKLFGSFRGPGMQGTAGWLEGMGLKPGQAWAAAAGGSEFVGGLLTAAGLLSPTGPITALAPMGIAAGKVHRGKPIWVTEGGAELPVTNVAVLGGLALTGPGRFSLDRLLGIRLPWFMSLLLALGTAAGVAVVMNTHPEQAEEAVSDTTAEAAQTTGTEQQARGQAASPGENGAQPAETHAGSR